VEDIQETTKNLELLTNAVKARCNQKAFVLEFGEVWFDQNTVAIIFKFADLVKQHTLPMIQILKMPSRYKRFSSKLLLNDYTSSKYHKATKPT